MATQPHVLGDWQLEGLIGCGGMGAVYAATHSVIGKRAAVKIVRAELCSDPSTRDRFLQEARVVNQIAHPNIVDIFHIGQLDDGRPYLVMELLKGRTLGERMREGAIAPAEACALLVQMCEGLAAAHAHGVVHRDLKPENVFLVDGEDGPVVKLVDWGIAKLMDGAQLSGTRTSTGQLVGTPQYMSPEQARSHAVDGRTDVYALGAIAYELFLGHPPFRADNAADLVTMHLRDTPATPKSLWTGIPDELDALLVAMLAKSASKRPSIDTIARTLRELEAHFIATGERPAIVAPPPRTWRRRQRKLALAACVSLAIAGTAIAKVARDPRPRPLSVPASVPPTPATAEARAPRTLDLHVVPPHAQVVVDGFGARADHGHVVQAVPAGPVHITVIAHGYAPYRRTVPASSGKILLDVHLHHRAPPAPAKVAVTSRPEGRRGVLDLDPDGTIDPF